MDVPFPLAASKRLINFFTFQISMFFSASFAWASLILAVDDAASARYLERSSGQKLDAAIHRVKINLVLGVVWICDVVVWVKERADI